MTSVESDLPAIVFSTKELPAGDRFDAWRACMAPLFDLEPLARRVLPICDVDVTACHLGGLMIGRIRLGADLHRGMRPPRKIRREPLDHVVVEVGLRGRCVGETPSGAFELTPGGIAVFDLARPMTVQSGKSETVALTLPRRLFDGHVAGAGIPHGTVLRGGMAGVLGDLVLSLYHNLSRLTVADAPRVSQATATLVAATLLPTSASLARARGPLGAVLAARARDYVRRHAARPDLSVAQVCTALRVSRSHLYRAFEADGGIARYVQRCRLAQAFAALSNQVDRRQVSEIAYDYGFSSAAHFARAFRRRYGMTPRDARAGGALGAVPRPASSEAAGIRRWLEDLSNDGSP
jgi:AraC-like DNA-binding protein